MQWSNIQPLSLEQIIKISKYPDIVEYKTFELKDFQCLQIDDIEMQLEDFQKSIWTKGFVELRSVVENMAEIV